MADRTRRTPSAVGDLQLASLRAVFLEMGDTQRAYRRRTGQRASAELLNAARSFKAAPTLPSLVAVAAFFDELGLLGW